MQEINHLPARDVSNYAEETRVRWTSRNTKRFAVPLRRYSQS
jgi:hypothetical protein